MDCLHLNGLTMRKPCEGFFKEESGMSPIRSARLVVKLYQFSILFFTSKTKMLYLHNCGLPFALNRDFNER